MYIKNPGHMTKMAAMPIYAGRPVTYKNLYYPIFLWCTYKNLYNPIFFQNTYKTLYFWILDTHETKIWNKSPFIERDVI